MPTKKNDIQKIFKFVLPALLLSSWLFSSHLISQERQDRKKEEEKRVSVPAASERSDLEERALRRKKLQEHKEGLNVSERTPPQLKTAKTPSDKDKEKIQLDRGGESKAEKDTAEQVVPATQEELRKQKIKPKSEESGNENKNSEGSSADKKDILEKRDTSDPRDPSTLDEKLPKEEDRTEDNSTQAEGSEAKKSTEKKIDHPKKENRGKKEGESKSKEENQKEEKVKDKKEKVTEIIKISKITKNIPKKFFIMRDIFSPDTMKPIDPKSQKKALPIKPLTPEPIKKVEEKPKEEEIKEDIETQIRNSFFYEGYVIKNSINYALVSMNGEFFAVTNDDIVMEKIKIIQIQRKIITVEVDSHRFEIQLKGDEENEIQE